MISVFHTFLPPNFFVVIIGIYTVGYSASTDLLNSKAAGFIINVRETGYVPVKFFDTLDYDVNKEFADFVGSMDFEVVKVGSEFSLRDDANFGDIHSDTFNNAAAIGKQFSHKVK